MMKALRNAQAPLVIPRTMVSVSLTTPEAPGGSHLHCTSTALLDETIIIGRHEYLKPQADTYRTLG